MLVADRSTAVVSQPLRRLPVKGDYAVLLLRLAEIRYLEARDKKVYAFTRDGVQHRTQYTMTQLESLLPGDKFVRIHESYLVWQDDIEELLFLGNHSYEIRLECDRRLPVGRSRYANLRRRLGLDASDILGSQMTQ